mgnify:CR=1 FL=1
MARNVFQQQVVPDKPKILAEERIYVYMPKAGDGKKGLASFNTRDFKAVEGHVSLNWPMEMIIETLADPTQRPAMTKVLPDEFIKTGTPVTVLNPVTGVSYETETAEIKLNRLNRNALARPDLVMLNSDDFEADNVAGYNKYKIKRNNPLLTPSLIQVDSGDFKRESGIVKVKWPYAHAGDFGLIKVDPGQDSSLKFDNNKLQVDIDKVRINLGPHISVRTTYTNPDASFYDDETGLAKRNESGNILLNITKEAVGLGNVANRTFVSRVYSEFGQPMKDHFNTEFGKKLNQSTWNNLFGDWAPISDDRNTVNKWFMRLEEEDNSLWSSIRTLNLFLGYYTDEIELNMAKPPSGSMLGAVAFNLDTGTYWGLKSVVPNRYQYFFRNHNGLESIIGQSINDRAMNITTAEEFVWTGSLWQPDGIHNDQWEWYDSEQADIEFHALVEQDAGSLQPNAPVANVSVGTSGKWIQSDHIHPSDPTKLDADLIENAIIQVTTNSPDEGDFSVTLAKVKVLDSLGNEIEATIVTTPQYLSSIESPTSGDLAIARSTGQIYEYNGDAWLYTNEVGTVSYDTQRTLNIPYIKTTQYLHNWKAHPTMFIQDEDSNEAYWAGTRDEFEELDPTDLPNNTLFIIEDDEIYEPGHFATVEQLDKAGITVSQEGAPSTDRFIIVESTLADSYVGVPLVLHKDASVPGQGSRYRLKPRVFPSADTSQAQTSRMIITVDSPNGPTLGLRKFTAGRVIVSNSDENLEVASFIPGNVILTDTGTSQVNLTLGITPRLLVAKGTNTIETYDSGPHAVAPLVSDGVGGVATRMLTPGRILRSNAQGELDETTWLESNVVRTSAGTSSQILLDANKVVISDNDNIIKVWNSGGVEGSLLVRGASDGTMKVMSHNFTNRILITGVNGKINELGAGQVGQFLVSNGSSAPGWVDGPSLDSYLPQTVLTSNPSAEEANAWTGGLVAVVLPAPIPTNKMHNNCIYYF